MPLSESARNDPPGLNDVVLDGGVVGVLAGRPAEVNQPRLVPKHHRTSRRAGHV